MFATCGTWLGDWAGTIDFFCRISGHATNGIL
jgi:hypothetical protein